MLDQATLDIAMGLAWEWPDVPVTREVTRNCEITELAQRRLCASAYSGVRNLQCEFRERTLVLSGRVQSFHEKQLAQEAVRDLCNDITILNDVEVGSSNEVNPSLG